MRHYIKLFAMGVLGVALGAGLMALVVPASAAPEKSVDQLWRETETLQYLHGLKLTAAQATQLADLSEPVHAMAVSVALNAETPEVVAAVAEIRAAALVGKPITEEMYKKVTTAKARAAAEWTDEATPTVWAAAAKAAATFVVSLSRDQQLAAARWAALGQAQTVVTGALGQADADAEAWTQWVADTLAELAVTNALADAASAQVEGFLQKVRGTSVETAQEDALAAELMNLLVAPGTDAELAALAGEALASQIAENRDLVTCLRDYAGAVTGG